MPQAKPPNWPEIVFDQSWLGQLDNLARNRFRYDGLDEEAATYVIDKLSEDNWQKLQTYTGNSAPRTFLFSISVNLLEEFSRKKFGRLRPPTWIQNEGGIWLSIWKKVCLERQPVPSVIDAMCTNEQRQPDFVKGVIATIKARLPWCGVKYRNISSDTDEERTDEPESPSVEHELSRENVDDKINLIAELLENLNRPSKPDNENSQLNGRQLLDILSNQLEVSEEDLLVVKMAFEDGLKLKVVAQALGMPAYQPGRILKRVFKQITAALEHVGVHTDDILNVLEEMGS